MSVKIEKSSTLQFATLRNVDGVEFWEKPEYPEIEPADDDLLITVESGDRIDVISNRLYGTSAYWRLIAVMNGLTLLPIALYKGQILRAPSPQRLLTRIVNVRS